MTLEDAVALDADSITSKAKALALLKALHGEGMSEEEAVIRYARRALALAKDKARKKSRRPAARCYTPDLSMVEDTSAIRAAAEVLEDVAASFRADAGPAPKTRKAAPAKAAPAKVVKESK